MASQSGTFAARRGKVAIAAFAAVIGLGLAAFPAAAGAAVSSASSPAANGAAAARQAPASGGPSKPGTQAALAMLAQRARMATGLRGATAGVGAVAGAAKATGSITGTVLGAESRPFAGACVTAVGSSVSVTAAAAPSGAFVLAGLAAGSYALEYRDCAAAGQYIPAWSGGVAWGSAAARVQVAANQVRHVPVMILKPWHAETVQSGAARFQQALAASNRSLTATAAAKTGRISGLVTGNGKPLPGICVIAFPLNSGQGYGATTAKNGTYAVRYMRPGRYDIFFGGFGCPSSGNWLAQAYPDINTPFVGPGPGGPTPVTVTSGQATRGINAHLRRGGQISGTVTGPAGRKLGGVCVNVTGNVPGGQIGFSAVTSAKGTYQLHALFPGKYSVQFAVGCGVAGNYAPATHRPVKISYGSIVSGVNEVLAPGASVTGRVTLGSSSGKPLAGMCVFASNADGSVQTQTATGRHGNYRVIGLGGGNYQLQIGPGCPDNGNYTSVSLSAHTTAGKQTSGVNAVLLPGATISGTVTDRKGRPVPGMCIELDQTNPNSGGFSALQPATANDGSYVVNQLPAGTYEIGFFTGCGNSANYAPYWFDNQTDQRLATPIVLATGATQTVNARLRPGAAIAGTVTDASGHDVPGLCVVAISESGLLSQGVVGFGQTGPKGRYTLSGMAPGDYLIDFGCGQDTRYGNQLFDGAATAGSAEFVSATEGRTTGIDAVLRPGGAISGVVTGKSGRPLAGVCVNAVDAKHPASQLNILSFLSGQGATTDPHGGYLLSDLAAGSYDILFAPCSGSSPYAEQWYRQHGSASLRTAVRVRSAKLTRGIDGQLGIGGSISGRVVDATAKPVRNICVEALDLTNGFANLAVTGRAGTYTIPALPTDTYTVYFVPCANQNLISVLSQAKVTAPHAVTGEDATMLPGGAISGVVTAAGSGSPLANTCVEVISSHPSNPGSFALTSSDGSYQAKGLAAGTYQVFFGDPTCIFTSRDLAPQWYNGQPTSATANPVTVTVGQTTPSIDAALRSDGQITGKVSGPTNAPLAGICVTAVPVSANLAGTQEIVAVSRTGGYTLTDLLPGSYDVEFSSGCGASGYVHQWWQDASSQTTATPVSVGFDQTVPDISATMSN